MRVSADSAALGMVGGRYCFKKCGSGCFGQIGDYGVVGDYGVAHPQRNGVGGQKGTDTVRPWITLTMSRRALLTHVLQTTTIKPI